MACSETHVTVYVTVLLTLLTLGTIYLLTGIYSITLLTRITLGVYTLLGPTYWHLLIISNDIIMI